MGDVKLAALMGLYLGRAVAPALLIGFLAGAAVGVVLMLREGAGARKRGDSLRSLPGPWGSRRPVGRQRAHRLVREHLSERLKRRIRAFCRRRCKRAIKKQREHSSLCRIAPMETQSLDGRISDAFHQQGKINRRPRRRGGKPGGGRGRRRRVARSAAGRDRPARERPHQGRRGRRRGGAQRDPARACSPSNKLSKSVRLGVANQRVAVRTLQLR